MLNARRHRSGIEGDDFRMVVKIPQCSTPEGIEAGSRRRTCSTAPGRTSGAQRPKASKRDRGRSPRHHGHGSQRVLNARRHRSGIEQIELYNSTSPFLSAQRPKASKRDRGARRRRGTPGTCRAQRPKASKRDRVLGALHLARRLTVLNARRHRSGIESSGGAANAMPSKCSTPEGIEAGSSLEDTTRAILAAMCSTPEGIEAGSSSATDSCVCPVRRCSTPEGIEAGSRVEPHPRLERREPVLNARRHRSGIECRAGGVRRRAAAVLNARRHRSGIEQPSDGRRVRLRECSTPEGIEAGSSEGV